MILFCIHFCHSTLLFIEIARLGKKATGFSGT